jgi:hypothetical protein
MRTLEKALKDFGKIYQHLIWLFLTPFSERPRGHSGKHSFIREACEGLVFIFTEAVSRPVMAQAHLLTVHLSHCPAGWVRKA